MTSIQVSSNQTRAAADLRVMPDDAHANSERAWPVGRHGLGSGDSAENESDTIVMGLLSGSNLFGLARDWEDLGWERTAPQQVSILDRTAQRIGPFFPTENFLSRPHASKDWLHEVLQELKAECEVPEEGYRPVADRTKKEAEALLRQLSRRVESPPSVYATAEGAVCIDFRNEKLDAAAVFICEPTGEAACYYDIGDKRGRSRHSAVHDMLEFVGWRILEEMGLRRSWLK